MRRHRHNLLHLLLLLVLLVLLLVLWCEDRAQRLHSTVTTSRQAAVALVCLVWQDVGLAWVVAAA